MTIENPLIAARQKRLCWAAMSCSFASVAAVLSLPEMLPAVPAMIVVSMLAGVFMVSAMAAHKRRTLQPCMFSLGGLAAGVAICSAAAALLLLPSKPAGDPASVTATEVLP